MLTRRKKILLGMLALLLLVVGFLFSRSPVAERIRTALYISGKNATHTHGREAKTVKYYCPMHPTYVSDKPGDCPVCQMKLVPMEGEPSDNPPSGGTSTSTPTGSPASPPMPGSPGATPSGAPASTGPTPQGLSAVNISPQKQQLIGVTTEEAKVRPLSKVIRTVGMVTIDERRIAEVHPKVSGWAEKVYVSTTWDHVQKGQPLLEIYSPELVQTQEEYLLALRTRDSLGKSSFKEIADGGSALLEAARRRLSLWDITEAQIRELEARGRPQKTMTLYSPMTGHVIQRNVYPSQRIEPNMKLYTIADHSVVWVNVDIYESEVRFLKVGDTVQLTTVAYPDEVFRGKVTLIWPHVEEKTRTLKARLELANPRLLLKPDMYTNAELQVPMGRQLTVPEDAVLNTGTQPYVFVDKGDGYFEPREVKLGAQAEGRYAIRQGLRAGERVVTSANFLIDSESRLRGALASMGPPQKAAPAAEKGAEPLKIELHTDPEPAKVGDNTVRVKLTDAKGTPITDASVRVTISMPAMGSMPPMNSEAKLSPKGNGEYAGTLNIPMAWTWQTVVIVERGGQRLGSYQTNITAK